MRRALWIATIMLTAFAAAPAEACPAKPSSPACLNKSASFTPAEQAECVGMALVYFAQSDMYLACLRAEVLRADMEATEARARLACRSTTKRPC